MSNSNEALSSTRQFWDANPCGVHSDYHQQRAHRYAMEPWLPPVLKEIAGRHRSFLEVGCGQGIDSTVICASMQPGGSYIGIDYSPQSVEISKRNAALLKSHLVTAPDYKVGNAEKLEFNDRDFDVVYSMGVLHHTADERQALREVHRVLRDGGTAYLFLYRKYAPKVMVAKMLRGFQQRLDLLFGTERCIYQWLKRRGSHSKLFGTMFHECFGVPYLKCYSKREMRALLTDFSDVKLVSIGPNLGRLSPGGRNPSPIGYFWFITAKKWR